MVLFLFLLLQHVVCGGPVDAMLTHLFTSLSTTLQDQLTIAITKHILRSDASSSQSSTLTSLPAIWSSSFATQVTVLSTQIALELCMASAVEETSSTQSKAPLQELYKEIGSLIAAASQLVHGKSSVTETIPETCSVAVPQSDSQLCLDSNIALRASASNVHGVESALSSELLIPDLQRVLRPSGLSHGYVSRDQTNKLQIVLLILSAYRQKIEQLCNLNCSPKLSGSFLWQSMLRFNWSSREQRCYLSTLDARIFYGNHYSGSWMKVVLTPATEKVLVFLLKAVQEGSSPLIQGPPVGLFPLLIILIRSGMYVKFTCISGLGLWKELPCTGASCKCGSASDFPALLT